MRTVKSSELSANAERSDIDSASAASSAAAPAVPQEESKAAMDADAAKLALKNNVVSVSLPTSVQNFFKNFVSDSAAYSWQRFVV